MTQNRVAFEDWREIHDLLMRITLALDLADWDEMRACLADDVTWSSVTSGEHSGIDGWVDAQRRGRSRLAHAAHAVSNVQIIVDGNSASAVSYVHGVDVHKDDETHKTEIVGRYHDTFVRRDDGWLFASRRFERVWIESARS